MNSMIMNGEHTELKRDRRRRDKDRMKAKAVRIRPDVAKAAFRADYLKACSCWMCGNWRRYTKTDRLTKQERLSLTHLAEFQAEP